MNKFPEPIPLPPSYTLSRSRRKKELVRSLCIGICFRVFIIVAELIGFAVFSSFSLLADGLASTVDVLFSFVLLFGIRFAVKPPDKNHPFGHGRIEPIAGLQLGTLLVVGGVLLGSQQFVSALSTVPDQSIHPFAWVIPTGAVILLEISYQCMSYYAKKNNSPALKADAVHYRIDALSSLIAAMALAVGVFYPTLSVAFDHFGAFLIAILMVFVGIQASRNNFHQLMDTVPSDEYFDEVRKAALRIEGVLETEKLRIRFFGPDAHIDIDIEVDPKLPVDQAHRISQKVRAEIQSCWPAVRDVMVHIEPYYPNDHL